jgi:protein-disulfide isomerase
MSKRFLLVLAVVIIAFGGIFFLNKHKAAAPSSKGASGHTTNHLFGNNKKGVILVEYGDYQCPACGAYYPLVKALADKYKDDIYLQFRNFPLVQIHPNAFAGARAAEAADKQGKFWEMHDILYEQQKTWSVATNTKVYFDQYANRLGLNITQFDNDYSGSDINDLINSDIQAGQAIGANSTPTFVLDVKKIQDNPQDQASFNKLIENAIGAKTKK